MCSRETFKSRIWVDYGNFCSITLCVEKIIGSYKFLYRMKLSQDNHCDALRIYVRNFNLHELKYRDTMFSFTLTLCLDWFYCKKVWRTKSLELLFLSAQRKIHTLKNKKGKTMIAKAVTITTIIVIQKYSIRGRFSSVKRYWLKKFQKIKFLALLKKYLSTGQVSDRL